MSSDLEYLRTSLARLGDRRGAFVAAACAERDRKAREGDVVLAEVWNALASCMRDLVVKERSTLLAMEADLGPVTRRLTSEELEESRFDDE